MDNVASALSLFHKARAQYVSGSFEAARKTVAQYRDTVEYAALPVYEQRGGPEPAVTVVVVCYRPGLSIQACVASLREQRDADFEVVIVDNGGTLDLATCHGLPFLHIRVPDNVLPSEGRNIGTWFARGRTLAFVDDDATVDPGFVAAVKSAFDSLDFLAVRGRVLPRSETNNNSFVGHYDLGAYPVPALLMTEGNMAIRKDVIRSLDGFDPLVFGGEGTELSYRCLKAYPGRQIYYWPGMVIRHDFAAGKDLAAKKARHSLSRRYFDYLDPEINRLQKRYARWYKQHPNPTAGYDERCFQQKLSAYLAEKSMALTRLFGR